MAGSASAAHSRFLRPVPLSWPELGLIKEHEKTKFREMVLKCFDIWGLWAPSTPRLHLKKIEGGDFRAHAPKGAINECEHDAQDTIKLRSSCPTDS